MTNKSNLSYVLDSSAALALIKKEKGSEIVESNLKNVVMSSVNYAEVVSVLVKNLPPDAVEQLLSKVITETEPFAKDMAMRSGLLLLQTQKYGLSLGDRACIALAQEKRMPVLTADKIWIKLNLGVKIKCIRD